MNLLCCYENTSSTPAPADNSTASNSAGQQASSSKPKLPEGALEICRKFDKDGNGYISKSEVRDVVGSSLKKEDLDELMKRADTNHDGKVDYEEFFKAAFAKE